MIFIEFLHINFSKLWVIFPAPILFYIDITEDFTVFTIMINFIYWFLFCILQFFFYSRVPISSYFPVYKVWGSTSRCWMYGIVVKRDYFVYFFFYSIGIVLCSLSTSELDEWLLFDVKWISIFLSFRNSKRGKALNPNSLSVTIFFILPIIPKHWVSALLNSIHVRFSILIACVIVGFTTSPPFHNRRSSLFSQFYKSQFLFLRMYWSHRPFVL